MGILVLAANTAYQDFPRLSAILANDRLMPRQMRNRGDRLVYSNGIVVLSLAADRPHHRVRRHALPADPALRGRRVRQFHPEPDIDGAALVAIRVPPVGARSMIINAIGATTTGIGARRGGGRQVLEGCLGRGGGHPPAGRSVCLGSGVTTNGWRPS